MAWPTTTWQQNAAPGRTAATAMNATGRKFSVIVEAPFTGTIDAFFIRVNAVTGTGVQVTGAIQGVSATDGDSDGADYGGSSPSAGVSVASSTGYRIALTTGAAVTKGDLISVVVTISAGTTPTVAILMDSWQQAFPYCVLNNGSVTKQANKPLVALEYATLGYVYTPNVNPNTDAYTVSAYNSGTGTNRRALKMTLPFGGVASGFWLMASLGGDADMNLRNAAHSIISARSLDKDVNGSTVGYREYQFTAPSTLAAGDVVRLSLEPSSVTNISTYEYTFPTGLYTGTDPVKLLQGGTSAVLSTWNGSVWTDSVVAKPMMGLLFDQIYDSGGSSLPLGIRTGGGL